MPSNRSTKPASLAVIARERRDLDRVVHDVHRSPELGFGGLLVDLEQELARAILRLDVHAVLGGERAQVVDRRAQIDAHTGLLLDEVDHRGAAPRRREVEIASAVGDLGRSEDLGGEVRDELLDEPHDVGVVGVGLVQLEHRELGVVAR